MARAFPVDTGGVMEEVADPKKPKVKFGLDAIPLEPRRTSQAHHVVLPGEKVRKATIEEELAADPIREAPAATAESVDAKAVKMLAQLEALRESKRFNKLSHKQRIAVPSMLMLLRDLLGKSDPHGVQMSVSDYLGVNIENPPKG